MRTAPVLTIALLKAECRMKNPGYTQETPRSQVWDYVQNDFLMRLVIVSNRLPFTAAMGDDGPQFTSSSGGLTTGLSSYLARTRAGLADPIEFVWFGWPGTTIAPEHQEAVREHGRTHFHVSPVFLPEESMDRFYHGFCNKTIWPLFHYFPSLTRYEEGYWQE